MKITKYDAIYVEDQHKIQGVILDDGAYQKAIGAMICVCADAIIIE